MIVIRQPPATANISCFHGTDDMIKKIKPKGKKGIIRLIGQKMKDTSEYLLKWRSKLKNWARKL